MDPYDLAAIARVAITRLESNFSRGQLATMAKVSRSVISDFLNQQQKQPQIGMDKVSNLARALKLPVADLLGPVLNSPQKLSGMSSPVIDPQVNSASQVNRGENTDGAEAGALRAENERLRQQVKEQSDVLHHIANSLGDLAVGRRAPGRVSKARARKPRPR